MRWKKPKRGSSGERNRHSSAKKTELNGIVFPSKAEAKEYENLLWREKAGEIYKLKRQPAFPLFVNSFFVGVYTPDFSYRLAGKEELYIIEVKGRVMRDFPLRRNLFKALYPQFRYLVVKNGVTKEVKLKTEEQYRKKTIREFDI